MAIEPHDCCWHGWRQDTYGMNRTEIQTCCHCPAQLWTTWVLERAEGHGPLAPREVWVKKSEETR